MARSQQYDTNEAYRRHNQSFHAARLECDSAATKGSSEGADGAELNTFIHTRRVTVGLGVVNAAGLSALITGGAITLLSRRVAFVKRHILPQRAQWSVSMAIVSATHLVNNAASLGILDNCYGQLFASSTATGATMRRAYKSAWGGEPPNPFLRAADFIARSPLGGEDARLAAKVGRYALLLPFVPDPSGRTTVAARAAFVASTLPSGMVPSDVIQSLARIAEGAYGQPPAASLQGGAPAHAPAQEGSGASGDAEEELVVFDDSSWDPYSPGGRKAGMLAVAKPAAPSAPASAALPQEPVAQDPWAELFGKADPLLHDGRTDQYNEGDEPDRSGDPVPSWEARRRRRDDVRS